MAKQRTSQKSKRKPNNRRLRRSVMGTLSAVFMVSAIIVALIPTPKLQAALDEVLPSGLLANASATPNATIPDYSNNIARYPIFADYEGKFRVAYGSNGGSFTGIMVGFDKDREVVGKRLSIPTNINAFWYDPTLRKYIAVSAENNPQPLYYEAQERVEAVVDPDTGAVITPAIDQVLTLCTGDTLNIWENKPLYIMQRTGYSPSNPSPIETYVMDPNNLSLPSPTAAVQLAIPIQYIGSYKFDFDVETVTYFGDPGGAYHTPGLIALDDNGNQLLDEFGNNMLDDNGRQMEIGVFEGARNFDTLDIPDAILAVGNRAFYGCQMKAINIADRTNSIGNYAFQKCNQLTSVTFVSPTNLHEIGDYAFADCESLGSITIPDQVQKLGNFCFKNCNRLTAINLNGTNNDGNTSLATVGHGLFYNCGSLTQVVFPNNVSNIDQVEYTCFECKSLTYLGLPTNPGSFSKIFKANNVKGCNVLDTVCIPATDLKVDCNHPAYTGAGYKNIYTGGSVDAFGKENLGYNYAFPEDYEVSEKFSIKAFKSSYAYEYTQQHNMAFCYMDNGYEGWYEKSLEGYAFCVNEDNQLVRFEKRDGDGKNVIIPDNIAGFHVKSISTQTFKGNTDMVFLYIPNSVETIEADAFKDCVNLRTVYFDDVYSVQSIGADAFAIHETKAPGDMESDGLTEYGGLRFIGKIDQNTQPYQYAMNIGNTINASGVPAQYIKLCSQFPENLEVEMVVDYDPATNQVIKSTPTLVGIPTMDKARDGKFSLTNYTTTSTENLPIRTSVSENNIAVSAYGHYIGDPTKPLNSYSEDEAAVLSAIFNIEIPEGVLAFKEGIFQNQAVKSVLTESISNIPADTFKDCDKLESFVMKESGNPNGEAIGKTAFQNCDKLTDVVLPATLSSFGSVPFLECDNLTDVDFSGSPKYTCENAIIYELDDQGKKDLILEVLKARGNIKYGDKIDKDEIAGVTAIAPYAFEHCDGITSVKLDDTTVKSIPERCFDGARKLEYCSMPESVRSIGDFAFRNTALRTAYVPNPIIYIGDNSFVTGNEDDPTNYTYLQGLTLQCPEDSVTVEYCNVRDGITAETFVPTFTVTFLDYDDYVLGTQQVRKGDGATAPRAERAGYTLVGWTERFDKVYEDIVTKAMYEEDNATNVDGYYSVTFQDFDGLYTWDTQWLKEGEFPVVPSRTPERDGYIFSYWSPSNFMNIPVTGNRVVKAFYDEDKGYIANAGTTFTVTFVDYDNSVLDSQTVAVGTCPVETKVTPVRKGYTFISWSPSNYASVPVYGDLTIKAIYQKGKKGTVDSGNNSGRVDSATSEEINPNQNSSNNNNSSNNGNANNNTGTNATASPSPKPNNGAGTVSGNAVGQNGSRNPASATKAPNTKVEVTKSGISNSNLVTAAVSGSNDNFVVKITDSDQARSEVEQALLAEYGSLDDLKFFAMDISLYDSTGTSKIENTNGISVTITMPLPDALAGYAGNNKAGAVKNGAFEKLGSRLITIDNVPCISFTATHFSPYAVYVETNHLTAADVSDVTPKTGDPIHPKWFLAIGLALMSVLMFLGKGSKNKIVKVIE